jgi:predicted TIM-barrel fold metal-dependent hydrolase
MSAMSYPVISADSHVTEPPGTYIDHIDPRFRERAPRMVWNEQLGDIFVIDGIPRPVPLGLVAAAGKDASEIRIAGGTRFADLHRGGWDPDARIEDQARDGVACEVIYPSVGMVLCAHRDFDYKQACFEAYNRWLAEFCGRHPARLLGCGQTAMRSPQDGIADLLAIRSLGLRGVMLPADPAGEDYDSPIWDPFWEKAIELGLPLSFHILTGRDEIFKARGPKLNGFLSIIRGCQDILGMLILGGVFERHPALRIVCVEADAGWVPHYMYRMDHAWKRHRNWLPASQSLSKLPSEYFRENVYTTFQDDWVAFEVAALMNHERLLWANDFPHSDSTWPWSQEMLARQAGKLTPVQRERVLSANTAELYGIDRAALS